jgi:hypothetical protein
MSTFMPNSNSIALAPKGAFQTEAAPHSQGIVQDTFRSALISEVQRAVRTAIVPLETTVQRAEKNINDKFALLRAEFEKASQERSRDLG